ncbi:MAG: hypothetical protein GY707_05595 [Desulfobacteraceae bacterium]|nr:hypothetical protein [Desulfobacteraceae bacterium]
MDEFNLNPTEIEKVTKGIGEMRDALLRIEAHRELIKDIADDLKKSYKIPTPVSRKTAAILLKPDKQTKAETELDMVDYLVELSKN